MNFSTRGQMLDMFITWKCVLIRKYCKEKHKSVICYRTASLGFEHTALFLKYSPPAFLPFSSNASKASLSTFLCFQPEWYSSDALQHPHVETPLYRLSQWIKIKWKCSDRKHSAGVMVPTPPSKRRDAGLLMFLRYDVCKQHLLSNIRLMKRKFMKLIH